MFNILLGHNQKKRYSWIKINCRIRKIFRNENLIYEYVKYSILDPKILKLNMN